MSHYVCDTQSHLILAHRLYDTANHLTTPRLGLDLSAAALQAGYEKGCYRCDYVVKITSVGVLTRLL